jgi:parallel beta-helix repeat protein
MTSVFICLLLINIFPLNTDGSDRSVDKFLVSQESLSQPLFTLKDTPLDLYNEHEPIVITNDLDFHEQAMNENWYGNGSLEQPYIITGNSFIETSYEESLISISNTRLHLIIEHCLFVGGATIIRFNNVSNGDISNNIAAYSGSSMIYTRNSSHLIIMNNIFTRSQTNGIYVRDSTELLIKNNTVHENEYSGVYVSQCDNITIITNSISKNMWGISLREPGNISIINNTFKNCGIYLRQSDLTSFRFTFIFGNQIDGKRLIFRYGKRDELISSNVGQVLLLNCSNIVVNDLLLTDSYVGLKIWNSSNVLVSNSTLANNTYGIDLENSHHVFFSSNDISKNQENGVQIKDSQNISFSRNNISFNQKGSFVDSSSNISFLENHITGNQDFGLFILDSSVMQILNNTITNNQGDTAVYIEKSSYIQIVNNTISHNNLNGIHIGEANNNLISNNTISSHKNTGIDTWKLKHTLIAFNIITHHNKGIKFGGGCENNTICFNDFLNNEEKGIVYHVYQLESQSTILIDNNFTHNYWDDWTGPDEDADGIVDIPYRTKGPLEGIDHYPLISPVRFVLVETTSNNTSGLAQPFLPSMVVMLFLLPVILFLVIIIIKRFPKQIDEVL